MSHNCGDVVKIVDKPRKEWPKNKLYWCGKVMTIDRVITSHNHRRYTTIEDYRDEDLDGSGWVWYDDDFQPYEPEEEELPYLD